MAADVHALDSDQRILWFFLHDRRGDAHSSAFYRNAPGVVAGQPARIGRPGTASGVQDGSLWVLVAGRFEIQMFADENAGSAASLDRLAGFVESFDLRGMASFAGDRLDGAGLSRFLPDLPGKD